MNLQHLIGDSGSCGSFLSYCQELDLYSAGTINEMTLRNMAFRLMIEVAQMFKQVS